MKNLENAVNECKRDIEAVGLKIGNIVSVTVNSRAKSRWGRCTRVCGAYKTAYKIEISKALLDDNIDDMALKDTIIHELLHTIEGGHTHTGAWKRAAELMNKTYGYNIKRCTSYEEKGLSEAQIIGVKNPSYIIKCNKCGHVNTFYRKSKVVNMFLIKPGVANSYYRCGICKAYNLELIKHS